jgi:hypothetical protein
LGGEELRLDFHGGAYFYLIVDERGDLGWEAYAAVGGGVAGEDADVHADGIVEPAEPEHGGANEVGAAGGGIDVKADAGADDAVFAIAKRAVERGAMVGVFF